jgi:hypothetical protein
MHIEDLTELSKKLNNHKFTQQALIAEMDLKPMVRQTMERNRSRQLEARQAACNALKFLDFQASLNSN